MSIIRAAFIWICSPLSSVRNGLELWLGKKYTVYSYPYQTLRESVYKIYVLYISRLYTHIQHIMLTEHTVYISKTMI